MGGKCDEKLTTKNHIQVVIAQEGQRVKTETSKYQMIMPKNHCKKSCVEQQNYGN